MNFLTGNYSLKGMILLFLGMFVVSGIAAHPGSAQDACTTDENTIRVNYSLYAEYWRNDNFSEALPYLRWILACAPGFPSNSDRNFRRTVDVYEGIGMASDDPVMKRAYLDSALYIHDVAVTRLEDAGIEADPFEWIFNKARFIQNHAADLEDLQVYVGSLYREAFDLDKTRLEAWYLNYIINDYVQRDQKTNAIEFMELAEESYQGNQEVLDLIEQWRGRLFTSPEERISFLEGQLADDPNSVELITDLFELYSEEQMRDKVYEMGERLMEVDPSARTFRMIAKMRLDDGDTATAIDLYEQSLSMEGGEDAAREVNYNIGIAHQQEGRLSRARTSFRAALAVDANFGDAIVAIGDLYVAAVQSCGTFEREDRAVYWLAADYFDRAAGIDQRTAAQARSRLASISRLFPDAEQKFFKNWNTGDSYRIDYGCYTWIAETTTVR